MARGNPNAIPPEAGKFRPGQSGNPGGKPKILREVEDLARSYSLVAIRGLVAIAQDQSAAAAARISAWNSVLDRAIGKPKQALELGGVDGEAIRLEVIRRVIIDPAKGG